MSLLLSQTGGGRWEAVEVQPRCLDVSRVPGEESTCGCIQRGAMFSQSNAMGERKPAKEMLGDLLFHCQTISNIITCQITLPGGRGRGGGGGGGGDRGWVGSQVCLQSLCGLLVHSASSYFESTFKAFLLYVLTISLGNRCY